MSLIAVQGGATGTGTVTVLAPVTNTNRTLTLPDSTGTVATAESTLTQFNASGSAPVYAARAWVNFNGTGTVAIRASGNVSSITDNGTGNYVVNFTTAMSDVNYVTQLTNGFIGAGEDWIFMAEFTGKATTSVPVKLANYTATAAVDSNSINVAIFR
jgi:hypothetical protein